jgi:hypothetical protein
MDLCVFDIFFKDFFNLDGLRSNECANCFDFLKYDFYDLIC